MIAPIRWLLGKVVRRQAKRMQLRFRKSTHRAREIQRRWLVSRLRRHRDTAFARDRGLAKISTVEEFRKRVPILTYDDFAPYIERVKNGEVSALLADPKIVMFAMTSGTTSSRKFIPVTKEYLDDYRRSWMIWGMHAFDKHKHLWFKGMIQIASDWDEFRSPSDVPCGSVSGLTAQMQKFVIRKTYCLPPTAAKLKDVQAKYYLAWRLGLVRDVGLMISANPSTMVSFARFGREHAESLIRDIHQGGIWDRFEISDAIRTEERHRLAANPERAKQLESVLSRTGGFSPKDVWPNFGLLGNWTGGSVGSYMRHYPELYGTPAVRDIGLIASEGRMTIPVEDGTPGGILDFTAGFFEFVPVAEIDAANPTILEGHELAEGRDYYILLSNSSGLYRYNIFDVVRCLGHEGRAPVLAFLNKGSSFSNLTGEKLSEHQVVQAVNAAMDEVGVRLTAYSLAPCWDEAAPYYGLFVEAADFPDAAQADRFAAAAERRLGAANSEYEEKRKSRRLAPVRLRTLPTGAWRAWDKARLAKTGGTAEQYKHPCLIADLEFEKQFPDSPAVR